MARRREPGCQRAHQFSSSLAAAALQDHICKTISLHDPVADLRRSRRANASNVPSSNRGGNNGQSFSEHARDTRHSIPRIDARGTSRQPSDGRQPNARAPSFPWSRPEVVLDPKLPPLTLAQRLGLVEAPHHSPTLSEAEWASVKSASLARGDSHHPCPICQADFGLRDQVLLSCSHVFHRTCLLSFERYSGKKCCPMCRRPNYQTRLIHEGARLFREGAATRIQAIWRGYKGRMQYKEHRRRVPPQDPSLRKKYFEQKLSSLTDQLVGTCLTRVSGVQSLISRADENMAAARNLTRLLDLRMQQQEVDWATVATKAREKAATADCAVCLAPLSTPCVRRHRSLAVLSCSHTFHTACIQALEHFTGQDTIYLCPICRAPYERAQLEV